MMLCSLEMGVIDAAAWCCQRFPSLCPCHDCCSTEETLVVAKVGENEEVSSGAGCVEIPCLVGNFWVLNRDIEAGTLLQSRIKRAVEEALTLRSCLR